MFGIHFIFLLDLLRRSKVDFKTIQTWYHQFNLTEYYSSNTSKTFFLQSFPFAIQVKIKKVVQIDDSYFKLAIIFI